MGEMWRVLDTGLRSAAQNIALDRALLEARGADEISSTLRFARFAPCALLASGQSAAQEFDLDHCIAKNIEVQRRITGGDAIYCDGFQLAWALYLHQRDVRSADMPAIAKRVCHAAAAAVGALGAQAAFRARHDIEVDGCTIGSGGGVFDGEAVLYQGVIYMDLESGNRLRAIRNPAVAQSDAVLAALRERVTDLKTALGQRPDAGLLKHKLIEAFESEFDVELHDGDLSLTENARYQSALAEIDAPDWVHWMRQPASAAPLYAAVHKLAAGALGASLVCDRLSRRIKKVWFAYDGAIKPPRAIADLEAALRDTAVDGLERNVRAFFTGRAVDMQALSPEDFVKVVRRALQLPQAAQHP
jgi:lipoate-protein ligase A